MYKKENFIIAAELFTSAMITSGRLWLEVQKSFVPGKHSNHNHEEAETELPLVMQQLLLRVLGSLLVAMQSIGHLNRFGGDVTLLLKKKESLVFILLYPIDSGCK